jgi:hypothetical protein
MPYTDHFTLADDYITHLDAVIGGITDPFINSRYTGFLSVSAVTVYELALKDDISRIRTRQTQASWKFYKRLLRTY